MDDRPAILLVSEENADFLLDEFGRYARDYDVRAARSAAEAATTVKGLYRDGRQLALVVSESVLPDDDVLAMFQRLRTYVPTCAPRDRGALEPLPRATPSGLRPALAKGKYDAYLLMPRGERDEEFHTADLRAALGLGLDRGGARWSRALRIVSPTNDGVTLAVRDYLDRIGVPALVHHPDSDVGREVLGRLDEGRAARTRSSSGGTAIPYAVTSVRDVAMSHLRPSRRDRRRQRRRPRHRRRRAGRPRRVGVRRVRGPQHGRRSRPRRSAARPAPRSMIRNYLGFPRGISGMRLAQRARNQAIRFGTQFFTGWPATALEVGRDGAPHVVRTEGGDVRARAVVIASGVTYRKLGVETIDGLVGRGVNYGAAMTAAREMEGVRRLRRGRRQLRRPGRDPSVALRPQRHDPGTPARPQSRPCRRT